MEYVSLGKSLIYLINHINIPIVQGNTVINFMDYLPILKSGFTTYNMLENMLYDYASIRQLDYKDIELFQNAFSMTAEYVDSNIGKITMNAALNKKLIEKPLTTYQLIDLFNGDPDDLANLLYYNYISSSDSQVLNTFIKKLKNKITLEESYEQDISVLIADNEFTYIPLEALVMAMKDVTILLNDDRIKLYVAIIIGNVDLVSLYIKTIDARMDNNQAYELAVKYGNNDIINLIKTDIINKNWYENEMFNQGFGENYVKNDIKSYYRKYI
jgi:hypothetical protein